MFSYKKTLKLKDFRKRALRFLYNDFVTPYDAIIKYIRFGYCGTKSKCEAFVLKYTRH